MKTISYILTVAFLATLPFAAQTPKPKRINRAIELLEAGQPIYYAGGRGGYEEGRKMAATKADYINYEMEHGTFDMKELRDFMRGLVDAGPTRTGHRTPAVIVTLPVLGKDPVSMRANHWVVQQTLAAGVHGILLCHAESAEAIREFVEAARYPFAEKAMNLGQGYRGSGSQNFASQIWGISQAEMPRRTRRFRASRSPSGALAISPSISSECPPVAAAMKAEAGEAVRIALCIRRCSG
jgi:4-hydroxy-2-oxoheptanedioate aldolase